MKLNNLDSFSYSKKDHINNFSNYNIDKILYGKSLTNENCNLIEYQNMLIFSFVKENYNPGSKLLEIGKSNTQVSKLLSRQGYECWKLGFMFVLSENGKYSIEWTIKNKKGDIENEIPLEFFDFSYSVSAFVNLPESNVIYKQILDKIKSPLKPFAYSLFCFKNIANENKHVWYNKFMDYFFENVSTAESRIPYKSLLADKNIKTFSEHNISNKSADDLTTDENGRLFSYSVLWQNKDIFQIKRFDDFIFSKNSHFNIFNYAGFSKKIYATDISDPDKSIRKYQHLLLFSFLNANIREGSKILIMGDYDTDATEKMKDRYNLFFLNNSDLLSEKIITSDSEINLPLIDTYGNSLNFIPFKFFDLIFSFNGFVFSKSNYRKFRNLDANLYFLTAPFGLSLFSFKNIILNDGLIKSEFIKYILQSKEIFNRSEENKNIRTINDIYIEKDSNTYLYENNHKTDIENICYNILWINRPKLPIITASKPSVSLNSRPAYFFHHIMKCGGTSVVHVLQNWFNLIIDHYEKDSGIHLDLNDYLKHKIISDNIFSDTCIVAHFQHSGGYLTQRYPEIIHRPFEFRAFTFVREPMELLISLYYYKRKNISSTLQHFLSAQSNFLAGLTQCTESNYKEVINRYFFVGVVERMQESFDILADITGKQRQTLPFANKSKKDNQISELLPDFIKKFKKNNEIDYLIYNYCLEKLIKY